MPHIIVCVFKEGARLAADRFACTESAIEFNVDRASSVLRLTDCQCTSTHFGCVATDEGNLVAHEPHARGCSRTALIGQSGAHVKLEK